MESLVTTIEKSRHAKLQPILKFLFFAWVVQALGDIAFAYSFSFILIEITVSAAPSQ